MDPETERSADVIRGEVKMEHELKTWSEPFQAMWEGRKSFEFRRNDRDFQVGDFLLLKEWNPGSGYTGRGITVDVTYILYEGFGLPDGYCIMSLDMDCRCHTEMI